MFEFAVHLSPQGHPEYIEFAGEKPWEVAPVDDEEISAEADWLCLLALYTAMKRAEPGADLDHCPCLSEQNRDHAQSLGEALCNPKNYNKPHKISVEDNVGKIDTDKRFWMVKIFGDIPKDRYLTGSRSQGAGKIAFLPEVNIKVIGSKEQRIEGKRIGFEQVPIAVHRELEECYYNFLRRLLGLEKNIEVRLRVLDESDESIPEQIISSKLCVGNLRGTSLFEIEIETSYPTSCAVFWLASSGRVHSVFPFHQLADDPGYRPDGNKTGLKLRIGGSMRFVVHPPEGWDHCIVLENIKDFSAAETRAIVKIIAGSIDGVCFRGLAENCVPEMRKYVVARSVRMSQRSSMKAMYSRMRFGTRPSQDGWQKRLAKLLAGKATRLTVFSIPNCQS